MNGPVETIQIVDYGRGLTLNLTPELKKAYVLEQVDRPDTPIPPIPFEALEAITRAKGEYIGFQEIDGTAAEGFRVVDQTQTTTVWADASTAMPVRIEIISEGGQGVGGTTVKSVWTFTDFVWNEEYEASLFSVEPPDGYEVTREQISAALPDEKDLVEALRLWTDELDGAFPDELTREAAPSFGFQHSGQASVSLGSGQGERIGSVSSSHASPEEAKAMLEKRMRVDRGLLLVEYLIATNRDWHYAGAGARVDESRTSVCWWKVEDGRDYHVVYGDLSTEIVSPDQLPSYEGANASE